MKQVSGKELAKTIQRHGWRLARSKSSHRVFVKDGRRERIVIPMHGCHPLKIGLLRALLKIAGLSADDV